MHPILFHIGDFEVAYYGVLIAVGVLLGVVIAVRRAKSVGVSPNLIMDLAFYGIVIGFIGSRIFFILSDLRGFWQEPWAYIFSRQGYVFFGGLIFAAAFAIWYVHRKKNDPWQVADVLAPSIPLAHTFGRIGCFMSGCCYGRLCSKGWDFLGVTFPKVHNFGFAYWDHVARGWIDESATRSLPIYPVQLFEATANFLIFLGLMWLWRRRRFRGQIIAAYMIAYGTVRFLDEFLRGDYDDPALFGLLQRGQISQAICLAAIATAVYIFVRRRGTPLEVPAEPAVAPPKQNSQSPPSRRNKQKRGRRH